MGGSVCSRGIDRHARTEFDQCLSGLMATDRDGFAETLQKTQQAREHNASHRLNIQWQTVSGKT